MHSSVRAFVASVVDAQDLRHKSVLEVGSLDVNGNVRNLFEGPYVGVDLRPGKGVDKVGHLGQFPGVGLDFQVGLCLEVLEHDLTPWLTISMLAARLRRGAHVIVTCRGYDPEGCFPWHAEPVDVWRYTILGVTALMTASGIDVAECIPDPDETGVFAWGVTR